MEIITWFFVICLLGLIIYGLYVDSLPSDKQPIDRNCP
jgi:hypothetical protein